MRELHTFQIVSSNLTSGTTWQQKHSDCNRLSMLKVTDAEKLAGNKVSVDVSSSG